MEQLGTKRHGDGRPPRTVWYRSTNRRIIRAPRRSCRHRSAHSDSKLVHVARQPRVGETGGGRVDRGTRTRRRAMASRGARRRASARRRRRSRLRVTAVPTRRPMAQPTSTHARSSCRRGNQHSHAEWSTAHAPPVATDGSVGRTPMEAAQADSRSRPLRRRAASTAATGFRRHAVTEPVALGSLAVVRLVGALHSLLLDRKGVGPRQRLMRSRALSCSIDAPRCAPWLNGRRDLGRDGRARETRILRCPG